MWPKLVGGLGVGLVLPGLLGGCTPGRWSVARPTRPPVATAEVANATVLAIRPIARPETDGDGVAEARLQLLSAVGLHGRTGSGPLVEVIVREDSGRTIAIVQPPESGLRPGARVVAAGGAPVQLPRPAS